MAVNKFTYHPTINPFGYPTFSSASSRPAYTSFSAALKAFDPSSVASTATPENNDNYTYTADYALLETYKAIIRYAAEHGWPVSRIWNAAAFQQPQQQQQQRLFDIIHSPPCGNIPTTTGPPPLILVNHLGQGLDHVLNTCRGRCGGKCVPIGVALGGSPEIFRPEPVDVEMYIPEDIEMVDVDEDPDPVLDMHRDPDADSCLVSDSGDMGCPASGNGTGTGDKGVDANVLRAVISDAADRIVRESLIDVVQMLASLPASTTATPVATAATAPPATFSVTAGCSATAPTPPASTTTGVSPADAPSAFSAPADSSTASPAAAAATLLDLALEAELGCHHCRTLVSKNNSKSSQHHYHRPRLLRSSTRRMRRRRSR